MTQDAISESTTYFLSEVFNFILRVEELSLAGRPGNLSFKEIHVIEAVAKAAKDGQPARASDISAVLRVTPGTFTAAAELLEKKGYLTRTRDQSDRRSIRIALTETGEQALLQHHAFHRELTEEILAAINTEDARVLVRSLDTIHSFFKKKEAALKKSKVKILADSTCDIGLEEAARLGVIIAPMSILFGDEVYRQDVDLSTADFYKKLNESKTQPTSSQLTPYDLEQIYRKAAADGSEVVAIHLSSALSGTYQSAVLASREVTGVYPVDSQSATLGAALLVRIAVQLRDLGKSAVEIAEQIAALSERVRLFAYIPTLKYLVRSGRLSAAAGVVGNVLNVYPLVSVQDGTVKSIGKTRGEKAARKEIARLTAAEGIDKQYGVVFGHAIATDELAELKDSLSELTKDCEASDCEIGCVIGVHTGPGAVGIAFIAQKKGI